MPPVPNQFPKRPSSHPIAFVAEAPGADEARLGTPMVGASGCLLNAHLQAVGIDREECFVGNVCQWQPPANDLGAWPWIDERIQSGVIQLLADLAACNPWLIVTLGNAPLHLLHNGNVPTPWKEGQGHQWPTKVSRWRGSLFLAHTSLSHGQHEQAAQSMEGLPDMRHPVPGQLPGQFGDAGSIPAPCASFTPATAIGEAEDRSRTTGSASVGNDLAFGLARPGSLAGSSPAGGASFNGPASERASAIANLDSVALVAGKSPARDLPISRSWKVLATYHPAFILRTWARGFDLRHDLMRARQERNTRELCLGNIELSYGPTL